MIKKLDKAAFQTIKELTALRIPATLCASARQKLVGHLLAMPKVINVIDFSYMLFTLNP